MSLQISDGDLNAFVDGELSPHEAVRVTLAIASDRAIAQRVARLHQMKAAIAGFADIATAPDIPQRKPRRHAARRIALALVGAAAALAMLGLAAQILMQTAPGTANHTATNTAAQTIMAHHDHWTAQPQGTATPDLPDDFHWLAPVMQSSGLQLVHLAMPEGALHLGFKGPNACRISLFVTATERADSGLRMDISERTQHAQWQTGALAFEMIARDMAPARFATVATGLHQNSRTHAADPAMQFALLQAARLPCTV